mmetsp:Transcript_96479/g.259115  ORF Transcript_96479/g.259115 Transcript_96479/m.259115 type:complete len:346 (-) Transcript_96479:140-1177(-)
MTMLSPFATCVHVSMLAYARSAALRYDIEAGANPRMWASTPGGKSGIRKIIHQTWKTDQLPGRLKNWSESWKTCLPGWEHRLYTDSDTRDYIATRFPAFLATYDAYDRPIKRVDAFRYAVLAKEGGLYVDLDIECLRDPSSIFDSMEGMTDLLVCEGCNQISNAIMASTGPSQFFSKVVSLLQDPRVSPHHKGDVLYTTGPRFLTKAADWATSLHTQYWNQNGTTRTWTWKNTKNKKSGWFQGMLADDELFLAMRYSNGHDKSICMDRQQCLERFPKAYSVSHWMNSWSGFSAIPQRISCHEMFRALSGEVHPQDVPGRIEQKSTTGVQGREYMRGLLDIYLSSC